MSTRFVSTDAGAGRTLIEPNHNAKLVLRDVSPQASLS